MIHLDLPSIAVFGRILFLIAWSAMPSQAAVPSVPVPERTLTLSYAPPRWLVIQGEHIPAREIRGRIYLVPNDVPALLARYARDFPEHHAPVRTLDRPVTSLASPDVRYTVPEKPYTDIHFRGVTDPGDSQSGWLRGVTPAHGTLATHRALHDDREFIHAPAFPLELPFGFSRLRYVEPWYFGVARDMAWVQMFRPEDRVWLSQSPSGGGSGCPAWDFQWFIPQPQVGRCYRMKMRATYLPLERPRDIESVRERVLETVSRSRP